MKKKIMIVDDNKALVGMLKEFISNTNDLTLLKEAYHGAEAWKYIKDNYSEIDALILDLVMPEKDGMYLLDKLKENKINLKILVLTSYNEQETIRNVSEYGVKYFMLKPFDLQELHKRIQDITNPKAKEAKIINVEKNNTQAMITKLLHELGIPSHIKGYQYIREAINMVYDDPKLIGGITKELYPEISTKYGQSVTRVERAIRHAIEVSWNRGDWDLMEEIFGHSVDIDRAKPTNSEFIVTIADKLRLDMLKIH